jgi:uncharacterized membrane protein
VEPESNSLGDEARAALLAEATDEVRRDPASYTIALAAIAGIAWFIGALLVVFAVLIGAELVIPGFRLENATGMAGTLSGIAFLVAWLGLAVSGTAWTLRRRNRIRSRRP